MGSKEIAIFGILLAIVLLISSDVAARELTETSNTINTSKEDKKINGDNGHAPITAPSVDPKRPFCNRKVYGRCVSAPPKKRKCDYKNICRPPGTSPTKDASTETIIGGEKTDAEVQAKPHN